jgi:threonine dehydrogenase-like Zn-dependent dehydrogenase
MRAAFCLEAGTDRIARFELRTTEKPSLAGLPPGAVLLKTVAASICGSDLWGKGGCCGLDWRKPVDYLDTKRSCRGGTGHEILGEIVATLEPCSLRAGQRVLAMSPIYIKRTQPLGDSFREATGVDPSELPEQGGFAEYVVSHAACCLLVPDRWSNFDARYFVAAQPLATILHAAKHLDNIIGCDVAIVGQGQNGLMMTQLLANLGARRIIALDLLPDRLEKSKQCKATHVVQVSLDDMISPAKEQVKRITNEGMCDVVVDCVGHNSRSIDLAAQLAADGGTVLLFGIPPAAQERQMCIRNCDFMRNIKYVTSNSPDTKTFRLALDLLEQGRFDPTALFTHEIPFERFPEAYEMASNYKDGVVKILLTFDE